MKHERRRFLRVAETRGEDESHYPELAAIALILIVAWFNAPGLIF